MQVSSCPSGRQAPFTVARRALQCRAVAAPVRAASAKTGCRGSPNEAAASTAWTTLPPPSPDLSRLRIPPGVVCIVHISMQHFLCCYHGQPSSWVTPPCALPSAGRHCRDSWQVHGAGAGGGAGRFGVHRRGGGAPAVAAPNLQGHRADGRPASGQGGLLAGWCVHWRRPWLGDPGAIQHVAWQATLNVNCKVKSTTCSSILLCLLGCTPAACTVYLR